MTINNRLFEVANPVLDTGPTYFSNLASAEEQYAKVISSVYKREILFEDIAVISPMKSLRSNSININRVPPGINDSLLEVFIKFLPRRVITRGINTYTDEYIALDGPPIMEHLIGNLNQYFPPIPRDPHTGVDYSINRLHREFEKLTNCLVDGGKEYINKLLLPMIPNISMFGKLAPKVRDSDMLNIVKAVIFFCVPGYQLRRSEIEIIKECIDKHIPVYTPRCKLEYKIFQGIETVSIHPVESHRNLGEYLLSSYRPVGVNPDAHRHNSFREHQGFQMRHTFATTAEINVATVTDATVRPIFTNFTTGV